MQGILFDTTEEAPPRPAADDWPELKRATLDVLVTPEGDPLDDFPAVVVPRQVNQEYPDATPAEIADALTELEDGGYLERDGDRLNITEAGREALGL